MKIHCACQFTPSRSSGKNGEKILWSPLNHVPSIEGRKTAKKIFGVVLVMTHKQNTQENQLLITSSTFEIKNNMVITRIALTFLFDFIFCSQLWFAVGAVEDYAVYFDPNNQGENHNPKGSGYQPLGPYDWKNVVSVSLISNFYFISAIKIHI